MGSGRLKGWTATIYPFADNPTFGLPVVFYSVPATNPDGPASPFVDRFWDARENWLPLGIGMDPTSFAPYFGPLPGPTVGPLVGSADQWANGLSYATWLAGGYTNPNGCVTVAGQVVVGRLKQAQRITSISPPTRGVNQAQQLTTSYGLGVASPCCAGLLPTTVYLNISGSGSSDGKYPLTYNAPSHAWVIAGNIGSCTNPLVNAFIQCTSLPSNWTLSYRKASPGTGFNQIANVAGTCNPLHIVFTGLVAWCGDLTPGTWTITQT